MLGILYCLSQSCFGHHFPLCAHHWIKRAHLLPVVSLLLSDPKTLPQIWKWNWLSVALAGFWCPAWGGLTLRWVSISPSPAGACLLLVPPAPHRLHDYILSWGTSASPVSVPPVISIPGCDSLRRVCAERFWCLLRAAGWWKLLHHLWKQALGSAVQPE